LNRVSRQNAGREVTLAGQHIPVLLQGPGRVQWLIATEAGGHWYVDLGRSSSLAFGPACN
jgi:hypothetical protein